MAVTVLGMVLGACILGFSQALKGVATARNQMAATHFARDEVEGLRTLKYTNSLLNAGTVLISNSTYTGWYTVSNLEANVKNVSVSIRYQNHLRGGQSTNTLFTSLTRTMH